MTAVKRGRMIASSALISIMVAACGGAPAATSAPTQSPAATVAPAATAAPAATVAAPTRAPEATAGGPVTVSRFVMFRDDGKGEPGAEVKAFKQADRMLHLAYELSGFVTGKAIKIAFIGEETSEGRDIAFGELQGNVLLGNRITAKAPVTGKLPIGRYRADLYLGDQLVTKAQFTIEPDQGETPIAAGEAKLFRDNGQGKAGAEVASFVPTDRVMHFAVATTGVGLAKRKITWVYTALDTTAGKGKVTEATDERIFEDTTLTSFLELTQDAPVGKFQVELFVDGKLLKTVPFEVKR